MHAIEYNILLPIRAEMMQSTRIFTCSVKIGVATTHGSNGTILVAHK